MVVAWSSPVVTGYRLMTPRYHLHLSILLLLTESMATLVHEVEEMGETMDVLSLVNRVFHPQQPQGNN